LITRKDVQKVAALAHLQLSEAELDRMTAELGSILDHIATLSEVPTSHISPTSQVLDLQNVLRDDVIRPCLPVEAVLANAPDREDGWFRVRAVLDVEEVAE
jgi:aspartyl-tRNA(Asn)/glutamyl-tRNA(Gln) amidotransferase subunit C